MNHASVVNELNAPMNYMQRTEYGWRLAKKCIGMQHMYSVLLSTIERYGPMVASTFGNRPMGLCMEVYFIGLYI